MGTNPQRVALGDVDQDGDLDLFTLNGGTVSVRLNTGPSTSFSTGYEVPAGSNAQGLAVGDLDGDGDLDLAIANNNGALGAGFTLKLNNGNNTFTTSPSGVTNAGLNSVAVGDMDGDGDLDLVVGGTETSSVSVWLNNGQAAFSRPRNATTTYGNQEVTLGDVDKDGDLDLLVATFSNGSRTVSVRLNTNATFGGGQNVGVGRDPRSVAVGDLDGDGDLDFVAASGQDNTVSVRLNSGTGTFSASQEVGVGSTPNSVAVGDVDGDGDLDFVAANSGGTTASVCLNDGNGRFVYANNQQVATGSRPYSIALGDVDGDGDLDLATANSGNATASIRLNQNQALPLPIISSLSTASSAVGRGVVITGGNFLNVTEVTFNGVAVPAARLVPNSLTQLTVVVPPGASTGPVVVVTTAGSSNGVLLTISPSAQVTAVLPTPNAVAAPRTTAVAVTFDQPLNAGAATLGAIRVFGSQAGGSKAGSATVSGTTLTFTPAVPFKPGETVQATVSARAQSTTGAAAGPYVFEFTAATSPAAGVFGGGSELSVSSSLQGLATGDVDGDGDLDLVIASSIASSFVLSNVSVRLNNGTGSFSSGPEVVVGAAVSSLKLGDVDADGDLDLVTGSASSVSVRLNNGRGVFAGGQDISLNGAGDVVRLGDMDGDGDLDLVASDGVHFNAGSGTFSSPTIAAGSAANLALGDVDNDGDLDVVNTLLGASGLGSVELSVQLNNGAGGLSPGQVVLVGVGTSGEGVLGDIDQDGDLDLLGIAEFTNTVSVRFNDGHGTFSGGQQVPVSSRPEDLEVSDVDGDGDLDFLVADFTGLVSVRLNNGAGVFGSGQEVALAGNPYTLTTGDVNGDGAPDLLVARSGRASSVSIRLNQPTTIPLAITALAPMRNSVAAPRTGPVAVTFSQALSASPGTLAALKVFSAQAGGQKAGAVTVSGNTLSLTPAAAFKPGETVFVTVTAAVQASNGLNTGTGHVYQFTAATSRAQGAIYYPGFYGGADLAAGATNAGVVVAGVVTGDVDGDQDLDLVSAKGVQLNNGAAGFAPGATISSSGTPRSLSLGDVDGDGDLDVVIAANTGVGVVQVRLNNGRGSFSGTRQVSVGFDPAAVALADVDADGDLDLLTANYSSNSVSVRLNDGQGSFGGGSEVAVGEQPVSLVVGDVDNDGDLDLLTPSFSGTTVSLRLNSGTGTFSGSQEVGVGFNPHSVVLGDIDGDGDLDLLATNYNDYTPNYAGRSTLSVRLNTGSGTFTGTQNQQIASRGTVSAVLGDIDADGDLDLAVASENNYGVDNGTVDVYLNTNRGTFSHWQNVSVGSGVGSIAFGDLDDDGDVDLITGNGAAGTASVRLNQLPPEARRAVLQTAVGASPPALSVYPNPSSGRFTLSCTATQTQAATLLLTDQLGRVVQQQAVTMQAGANTFAVEAAAAAAGLYQLTLRTADGHTQQQKVVIQP